MAILHKTERQVVNYESLGHKGKHQAQRQLWTSILSCFFLFVFLRDFWLAFHRFLLLSPYRPFPPPPHNQQQPSSPKLPAIKVLFQVQITLPAKYTSATIKNFEVLVNPQPLLKEKIQDQEKAKKENLSLDGYLQLRQYIGNGCGSDRPGLWKVSSDQGMVEISVL